MPPTYNKALTLPLLCLFPATRLNVSAGTRFLQVNKHGFCASVLEQDQRCLRTFLLSIWLVEEWASRFMNESPKKILTMFLDIHVNPSFCTKS